MENKTSPCTKCKKRFNTLTEEGICFYCYVAKYKDTPKKGLYLEGKRK